MSSGEKQFPASDLKLQRLREQGIFPRSKDVTTSAIVIGIGLSWVLFAWYRLLGFSRDAFQAKFLNLSSFVGTLSDFAFPVIECVSGVALLFWLVQTGFFFRPRKFRHDEPFFGRRLFGVAIASLVKAFLCAGVMSLLFWPELRALGGEKRVAAEKAVLSAASLSFDECSLSSAQPVCPVSKALKGRVLSSLGLFTGVAGAAIILSFLLGILSRFMAGLSFERAHRMSRGELEAEARENSSPAAASGLLSDENQEVE